MVDLIFGGGCGNVYYYQRLPDGSLEHMPNITSGSSAIDVGFISCPSVFDWNGDGLADLMVGREFLNGGSVRLYENIGSQGEPSFSGFVPVSSSAGLIQKWRSAPQAGDLDGDGLVDLVLAACGNGPFDSTDDGPNWGWVYFFRNTGTVTAPEFDAPVKLYGGEELIYNYHHNICLFDWNGDGAADILSGDFEGDVRLYTSTVTQGTGSSTSNSLSFTLENPVAGMCNIFFSESADVPRSLELFSTLGRRISADSFFEIPAGVSSYSLSLEGLPSGTYLLSCRNDIGETASGKVVVLY